MSYSFHPDAKRELFEAINYYEECKDGLGLEFAKEVCMIDTLLLKNLINNPLEFSIYLLIVTI